MLEILATFVARLLLVMLFLPFSALDKILNFNQAVEQARQVVRLRPVATFLICAGLGVEVIMSLAVLTGVADRLAALILSGYCMMTALFWKQFWTSGDFRLRGPSKGRDIFWDFLKNFAVAGGFLMLTLGATSAAVQQFVRAPFASSHPYTVSDDGSDR